MFAFFLAAAWAADATDNSYVDALRAIDEGVPEVGVQKLRTFLDGSTDPATKAEASLKLAQALLAAGRAEESLKTLETSPAGENPDRDFVKAQALAGLGRWLDALPLFHQAAGRNDSSFVIAAKLGEAEALHALGRTRDAISALESVGAVDGTVRLRLASYCVEVGDLKKCAEFVSSVEPGSTAEAKWKQYIEGRLELADGKAAAALEIFKKLVADARGLSEGLLVGATLGMSEAVIAISGPESGDNIVEDYIGQHPESAYLDLLFKRLDRIYGAEDNPSEAELQKWAQKEPQSRGALALFYLAKAELREKKTEKALRHLATFVREYPDHSAAGEAWLIQGNLLLNDGKVSQAITAFEASMRKAENPDAAAEAEIGAGRAHFMQREFVLAANIFGSAARRSEKHWQTAVFNSSLAWLNQGNYDKFLDDYKELSAHFPESELRRDLLLEEGLLQARSDDPRAKGTLLLFATDFPGHPRLPEARLALAELAFASSKPGDAANYLKAANEASPNAETAERGEYLAIFMADAAGQRDEQKLIDECMRFIRQREGSALLPEVRMKLGQVYFRREDFANAETQFELLARRNPTSPYAETALFLAGQSSMRSMNPEGLDRALELFEEVAKLNGPLKLYARQEQAIAKKRLGKESEAIILYNDILASKPDAELRLGSLCGKGDALLALGAGDPKKFDEAIAVFDDLVTQAEATPAWRNQALYKKAKCLEKLGKKSEALAAFYDVLQAQSAGATEPEYFWFYKAGFDAARIFETDEQWKSAIGIYQKIGNVEGPRSEEAKARANQLRLEHFIWDD